MYRKINLGRYPWVPPSKRWLVPPDIRKPSPPQENRLIAIDTLFDAVLFSSFFRSPPPSVSRRTDNPEHRTEQRDRLALRPFVELLLVRRPCWCVCALRAPCTASDAVLLAARPTCLFFLLAYRRNFASFFVYLFRVLVRVQFQDNDGSNFATPSPFCTWTDKFERTFR